MKKFKAKKIIVLFAILLASYSCNIDQNANTISGELPFEEKIIDFLLANCDDKFIELPFIYDKTADKILNDKEESMIMAELLKKRGFVVTEWGRGNYPPRGPRIITLTLANKENECTVQKIYYSTLFEGIYETTERIKCGKLE